MLLCSLFWFVFAELSETLLRLDNGWLRFTLQLNLVRRVEPLMDDEHRQVHSETLRMFLSKLEIVTAILQRLQKQASNESGLDAAAWRVKYAFKKEGLDKAIEELEIWQRTADQSWFLLMKMADTQISAALARSAATVDHLSVAAAIPSTIAIRSGLQEAGSSATAGSGLTINAEELSRMSVWHVPYSHALCAQRLHSTGETTTYVFFFFWCLFL